MRRLFVVLILLTISSVVILILACSSISGGVAGVTGLAVTDSDLEKRLARLDEANPRVAEIIRDAVEYEKITSSDALAISLHALQEEFRADSTGSLIKYAGKILEVKGVVYVADTDPTRSISNVYVSITQEVDRGPSLACTLPRDAASQVEKLTIGEEITLKGVLEAGNVNGGLRLNNCSIQG